MGAGRSGSTLFEFLLAGTLHNARALGELETLVLRGLLNDELCSCRRPALACSKWTGILAGLSVDPLRHAWQSIFRNARSRRLWGIKVFCAAIRSNILGVRQQALPPQLQEYVPVLNVLARASSVGERLLIDNSKTPVHFLALAESRSVDLRVVHLLRMPHAVVWSWHRRKHLPETREASYYMEPRNPITSTGAWISDALKSASFPLLYPNVPYFRITYEELCANPQVVLRKCIRNLQLPTDASAAPSLEYHVLGGNPSRFGGFKRVELDNEWERQLPSGVRTALNIFALPIYRLLMRCRSDRSV